MRQHLVLASVLVMLVGCSMESNRTPDGLGTSVANPLYVAFPQGGLQVGPANNADFPLRLSSNSADMSFKTTWTLNPGSALRVVPRTGEAVVLRGQPIVADYWHMGRFLGVAIGAQQGAQKLYGFIEPISWEVIGETAPAAPAPAPAP